jgi:hypothetical protein
MTSDEFEVIFLKSIINSHDFQICFYYTEDTNVMFTFNVKSEQMYFFY